MIFHRLEFEAFMAYPKREVIDFDALNEAGIFLLNGPTGSGKTTVLDAICYALYGMPSSERDIGSLYSTHVPPGEIKPHIFLELSIQNRRLRIDRTPAYRRLITRGKNKGTPTLENPQALVSELIPGRDPQDEQSWRKAAEGMADSADYLTKLIGLNREQFLKVMLLPQGQFADFLKARSKDRIPLLKQLFPVDTYEQVMNRLREEEQISERAVQDIKHALDRTLEQTVTTYTKLCERLSRSGTDLDDNKNIVDAQEREVSEAYTKLDLATDLETARHDFEGWFTEHLHAVRRQEQQDEHALTDLKDKREKLAAQQQDIAQRIQDWAEYKKLQSAWVRHESQEEEHKKQCRTLSNSRAAAPVEAELERSRRDEERRMHAAEHAQDTLNMARSSASQALEALGDCTEHLEASLYRIDTAQDLQRVLNQAPSVMAQLRVYQHDEQALEEAKAALTALKRDSEKAQRTVEGFAKRELQSQQKLSDISKRLSSLHDVEQNYARAQIALETAKKTQQEVAAHAEKLEQALAAHDQAVRAYELIQRVSITASEEYTRLQKRRLEQVAFTLAEELDEGQPCMVCGSREHPQPAQPSVNGITLVEQSEIDAAEERAHREQQKASAAATSVAQTQTVLDQLNESHMPDSQEAQSQVTEAQNIYNQAQEALTHKREAQHKQEKETLELQKISEEQTRARTSLTQLQTQQASEQQTLKKLEKKLCQVVATISFADRVRLLESYVEQAHRAVDASRRLDDATISAAESAHQAQQSLERSVFETFEAVQQAVLTEVQQQHLEQAISAYQEEHATLQASLDRPAMCTVATLIEHGQKAPSQEELTRIRQERDNVEQHYETLMTREGIRTNGIETLESLFQDYQEQQGESAHAVEQANLYAGLASIARGDNPDKNHQIDLVSYVLGGEFEQVLQVASEHLQRMSDNRYRLVLSDKREKRARIGGGLSISVEDNWNNDQREVNSLSGGESFLASLSLALGLAEVVQARNGGIEIETLFIDEGFGTLDAQTLELVMETLENIRENGRVIGLISHVEDMKERISAQVSIEKRQNGSTLRVNV
ncbi:AAA family ATPase [Rothia sp. HMSC065G12]|uniref:AAA family ATPase n=1 Tax=Rothia sp. HMSC065G12 TaxID=1739308 RepID=UPI0008A49365|nr:SMC family ATPase [Rothia sp. HMSC065G12]OFK73861.1 nuclease SbcCD subunit C [Rothia sp. HMSC065G12]